MGERTRGLASGGEWYAREDRLRMTFRASHGDMDPARIRARTRCAAGDELLVSCARRLAPLEVLEAYEAGALTFRQLWRICEYTGEPDRQLRIAHLRRGAA